MKLVHRIVSFGIAAVVCLHASHVIRAQGGAPSILIEVSPPEAGPIGGSVRVVGTGPNVVDLNAIFGGRFISPIAVAGPPQINIEPLFDPGEFPDGPRRVTLTYRPVAIRANTPFIPGAVGWVLPARIGSTLTPESFLRRFLSDYILEVNGFKFADNDLIKPENVVFIGPIDGAVAGFPGQMIHIWAVNFAQRIGQPGSYRIRNIVRIPKTEPEPEFGLAFLAGELIIDITINIQPASSAAAMSSSLLSAPNHWAAVAEMQRDIHAALMR
ncbi:MAG: hypothetical protein NZ823_00110 [Blastocatellia bacterium]|nr:hypothetical protein [Blastocatellia bacterium]